MPNLNDTSTELMKIMSNIFLEQNSVLPLTTDKSLVFCSTIRYPERSIDDIYAENQLNNDTEIPEEIVLTKISTDGKIKTLKYHLRQIEEK